MKTTAGEVPKAFLDCFRQLVRRVQPAKALEPDTAADYYEVLKGFHIDVLRRAAKDLATTHTFFPSTAEWHEAAAALVAAQGPAPRARVMSVDQATEYARAQRLHYEDQPCSCARCFLAQVTDKPLRFVPDFDADDREVTAYHPLWKREVVTGHWAHGDELARWYRAKEKFFATPIAPRVRTMLPVTLRDREPGEEG